MSPGHRKEWIERFFNYGFTYSLTHAVDGETRQEYRRGAFCLGKDFTETELTLERGLNLALLAPELPGILCVVAAKTSRPLRTPGLFSR